MLNVSARRKGEEDPPPGWHQLRGCGARRQVLGREGVKLEIFTLMSRDVSQRCRSIRGVKTKGENVTFPTISIAILIKPGKKPSGNWGSG